MPDTKEAIKTDLIAIAKLNSIVNYDDKASLARACQIIETKNPFRSVYGKRYYTRLRQMLQTEDYPHICITCGNPIDGSAPMCKACEGALTKGVDASQTPASTPEKAKESAAEKTPKDSIKSKLKSGIVEKAAPILSRVVAFWKKHDRKQQIMAVLIAAAVLLALFFIGLRLMLVIACLAVALIGILRIIPDLKKTGDLRGLLSRSAIVRIFVPLLAAIIIFLTGLPSGGSSVQTGKNTGSSSVAQNGSITLKSQTGYTLDTDNDVKTVINSTDDADELLREVFPEKDGWSIRPAGESKWSPGYFWTPLGRTQKYAEEAIQEIVNEMNADRNTSEAQTLWNQFYQPRICYSGMIQNKQNGDSALLMISSTGRILRTPFPSEDLYDAVGQGVYFRVQ